MTQIPEIKPSSKRSSTRKPAKVKAKSTGTTAKGSVEKKSARRKRRHIVLAVMAAVVVLVVILGIIAVSSARTMYTEGLAAKADFDLAEASLTEQRFTDAHDQLGDVVVHLEASEQASARIFWMKWLPWVSTQFEAVDHIIAGGIHGAKGAQHISIVGDKIFNVVDGDDTSLAELGPKERRKILKTISETPEVFKEAQAELALAVAEFDQIPERGVVAPLAVVIEPLQDQLPLLNQLVNKALPFLEFAPQILGYPDEQTYLFLLQNNTELRATGGFIGSYGILKLESGDIKDFYTNNIYNLDYPHRDKIAAEEADVILPPDPIQKYLQVFEWYLRDSNWHPSFPKSAQKAIEFYQIEDGPEPQLDGVIAVDQAFIKSLLEITGPVEAEGDLYTPENLDDLLHEKVEISFEADGRTNASRKEIIGNLAGVLIDKILTLPKTQWGTAFEVVLRDLDQKSILLYFEDPASQDQAVKLGWAGAILDGYQGDYLMVVDSNLGAKKTDRVMKRNFTQELRKKDDNYIVDLTLNYQNDGFFDFFTTRYNSYTRIYVPRGSQLIDSNGFRTHDRNIGGELVQAATTQDEVSNRTVFEGFISIEPQTSEDITLQYKLPQHIADQIEAGEYSFYWQKQPGTEDVFTSSTLEFGARVDSLAGVDEWEQNGNTIMHSNREFLTDNDLTVQFK